MAFHIKLKKLSAVSAQQSGDAMNRGPYMLSADR
jgi:hypothetical protein